jgi:hypothetical protein
MKKNTIIAEFDRLCKNPFEEGSNITKAIRITTQRME